MWLQIIEISFNASRVTAEVNTGEIEDFRPRLDSFVGKCILEGIKNVHLFYHPDTIPRDVSILEEFAASNHLPVPLPRETDGGYHETRQSANSEPELRLCRYPESVSPKEYEPDQAKS